MKLLWKYLFCGLIGFGTLYSTASAQEVWIPDPHLQAAIRETLELPPDSVITQTDMLRLTGLEVWDHEISDLRGLEYATDMTSLVLLRGPIEDITPLATLSKLTFLDLGGNQIQDIRPLAALTNLRVLRLWSNRVVDISPLAGLTNLRELWLNDNQVTDFSPLARLTHLEILYIQGNLGGDISPISTANLTEFRYDAFCDVPNIPVEDSVMNRDYPSIFAAWHNIINLPTLSWEERIIYHDLYFTAYKLGLEWQPTAEGVQLVGNLENVKQQRDQLRSQNPNMVYLVGIYYYADHPESYPEDWPYWLRDESGDYIPDVGWSEVLIDFTQPGAQDHFVEQAIAIAECGIFDGIFLDWWNEEWPVLRHPRTREPYYDLEVEITARLSMLRRIREAVGDDFLIIVNTNRSRISRSAPYVNGTFMETLHVHDLHKELPEIESTLLWSEENLRYPQINSLEGWGLPDQPLDSAANQQRMRIFTTMSLTHSDGYVSLVTGISSVNHEHQYEIWPGHSNEHARGESHDHTHQHYWYDFWDADLGKPISEKGQRYENREGLFIREFTNGWAVYNRSGQPQTIRLPEQVTGVESGLRNRLHIIPDLDGEIYLKRTTDRHDVNGDGVVNVQDLVAVANGFGKSTPDVNGDGVVNIQDLVAVANRFGQ